MTRVSASVTLRGLRITHRRKSLDDAEQILSWERVVLTNNGAVAHTEDHAYRIRLSARQIRVADRAKSRAFLRAFSDRTLRFTNQARPVPRTLNLGMTIVFAAAAVVMPAVLMTDDGRSMHVIFESFNIAMATDSQDQFVRVTRVVALALGILILSGMPILGAIFSYCEYKAWRLAGIEGDEFLVQRGDEKRRFHSRDMEQRCTSGLHGHPQFSHDGNLYRLQKSRALPRLFTETLFPRKIDPAKARRRTMLLVIMIIAICAMITGLLMWGHAVNLVEKRALAMAPISCLFFVTILFLASRRDATQRFTPPPSPSPCSSPPPTNSTASSAPGSRCSGAP